MHRVTLDALRPLLADGAFLGVGRIGRPHDLAPFGNGVFPFQRHHQNGAFRHKLGQRLKKRLARVHGVKAFRLLAGNMQHLGAENLESPLLDGADDVPYAAAGNGVRFNDGKSALQSLHESVVLVDSRWFWLAALSSWLFAFARDVEFNWVLGTRNFLHRHRLPHQLDYRVANHRRRLGHADARGLEGTDLFRRRAMSAGNNGAGVAHAPSRRRGLPGDKRHHWLAHMRLDELGCRLLSIAADLANHDNGFRLRVALEKFQRIHEIRADDGVAANADGGGLPNAAPRELVHGFIGQRPRTRDDADVAFLVNEIGRAHV